MIGRKSSIFLLVDTGLIALIMRRKCCCQNSSDFKAQIASTAGTCCAGWMRIERRLGLKFWKILANKVAREEYLSARNESANKSKSAACISPRCRRTPPTNASSGSNKDVVNLLILIRIVNQLPIGGSESKRTLQIWTVECSSSEGSSSPQSGTSLILFIVKRQIQGGGSKSRQLRNLL